jgi:PT repeat
MILSVFILTLLCISPVCVVCADRISVRSRLYDTTGRKLQTLGRVEQLVLINAITDLPIAILTNNAVINVATLPTSSFNIQATTNGVVGSIRFGYNSNMNYQVESGQPFSFCGDISGNYKICSVLAIGRHIVTATPFSNASATGLAGTTFQVTFNITNITSTMAPTKAPKALTKVPTKAPTNSPTIAPTEAPAKAPTNSPTKPPANVPSREPIIAPTIAPTKSPTNAPTNAPTRAPTKAPIASPIQSPSVSQPSCVTPQVDNNHL